DYNGYQIAFGHRDGHGVGDNVFGVPRHFLAAAEEAGAAVAYQPLAGGLRIHRLPARTSADFHLGVRSGGDRTEGARELVRVLTGEDDVPVESVRGYLDVMSRLQSSSADDLAPVT